MEHLRSLAENAHSQNLHSTAIVLSEELICSTSAVDSDVIFCAKCYYSNGEPRRCLSLLERRGLLSHHKVMELSVRTKPIQSISKGDLTSEIPSILSITLNAVVLASQSLFLLGQYDDCLALLDELSFLDESSTNIEESIDLLRSLFSCDLRVSSLALLYCIIGKSLDLLDNRAKSLRALIISIELDPACTESVEYLVQNSMLSEMEKISLYNKVKNVLGDRVWLLAIYSKILKVQSDNLHSNTLLDAAASAKTADHFYQLGFLEESYRFSRYAFTLDPYNSDSIATYIASIVELKQTTELFYLSHELIKSHPKQAISWYAIGSYYWTINKHIAASKYFQKAVKVDKRFVQAWVMLGHTLSAQEEGEHAISAYRTAVRLLPNDHRPAVFMAKELLKSNYIPLSLQVLLGCYESQPSDQLLLNELGVAYMKIGQPVVAVDYFEKSIFAINSIANGNKVFESSLLCNYATALRKCNKYDDALFWYIKCLSVDPLDLNCHIGIGFTYHLMQSFHNAVLSYHKALSIQPNSKLCVQLLNQVMEDSKYYKECDCY